jgi:hypothetical protein
VNPPCILFIIDGFTLKHCIDEVYTDTEEYKEGAFKKCPSRAFIMLKFLEAERVMNKKLN